jgi:uncharacterized protein (UPF0248 family)
MTKHFLPKTLHWQDEVFLKQKGIKAFVGLDRYIDLIHRIVKVRKPTGSWWWKQFQYRLLSGANNGF